MFKLEIEDDVVFLDYCFAINSSCCENVVGIVNRDEGAVPDRYQRTAQKNFKLRNEIRNASRPQVCECFAFYVRSVRSWFFKRVSFLRGEKILVKTGDFDSFDLGRNIKKGETTIFFLGANIENGF